MIKKILLGMFLLLVFISCSNNEDNNELQQDSICDETNTSFSQIYNGLAESPSNQDWTSLDLETHSYTFEVSTDKVICKIGYQSLLDFNTTPYLIEIYDNTTNTLIYSDSHIFSSSSISYISISPIQILANHSYSIKRIQTEWNGNIENTIGRIIEGDFTFPITFEDLSITGSTFYGTADPLIDWGIIPYIDIVFQT